MKTFYDIDTPVTLARLSERGETEYLKAKQIPLFDLYFSFTGGPMLKEIERRFGAAVAIPLYCSVDPDKYYRLPVAKRYICQMSYMGTYAADRQRKLESMLCETALSCRSATLLLPDRSTLSPSSGRRTCKESCTSIRAGIRTCIRPRG